MAESDDFFAPRVSIPSISVKYEKPGVEFVGVIVPVEENGRQKGYLTTDQKNQDGTVKTWSDGRPRKQAVMTLQTNLTGWNLTSNEFQNRLKETGSDREDDGIRRVFIKGEGLEKPFRAAVAALGRAPKPGDKIKLKLVERRPKKAPSGEAYELPVFEVALQAGTDETIKQAVATKVKLDAMVQVDDDDPWAVPAQSGGGGGASTDEPPF
jgi:hypothetical protein